MSRLKIYKYFYLLFEKLYKKEHLKINHSDIKCHNCKEWFSISGIKYNHVYKDNSETDLCTCGQCEHTSEWLCMAGLFVEVNELKRSQEDEVK